MNIVQIGANRGNDDLSRIIGDTQPSKLVLVEPMSLHNNTLKEHYSWVKNLFIENSVINENEDNVTFYYHLDDGPGYEVASLEKEHIYQRHTHLSAERIESLIVNSMNINSLFDKYDLTEIDVLFIDAEGNDDTIIKTINFNKFIIKKIYFENLHIKDNNIYNFLIKKGYSITEKIGHNNWTSLAQKN